jgi:ethanolamine utilization protein EutN
MRRCRVIGNVVSSSKHPALAGKKLLVVRHHEETGDPNPGVGLAVDGAGAGIGDDVIVSDSGAAGRVVTGLENPPLRSVIIGIVD